MKTFLIILLVLSSIASIVLIIYVARFIGRTLGMLISIPFAFILQDFTILDIYNKEVMRRNKYKITFYKINGTKFTRICTRTKWSVIKFALKTAFRQYAVFKIQRINLIKL